MQVCEQEPGFVIGPLVSPKIGRSTAFWTYILGLGWIAIGVVESLHFYNLRPWSYGTCSAFKTHLLHEPEMRLALHLRRAPIWFDSAIKKQFHVRLRLQFSNVIHRLQNVPEHPHYWELRASLRAAHPGSFKILSIRNSPKLMPIQ